MMCIKSKVISKNIWLHCVNPSYSMHSTWISRGVTGRSIQNSCYLRVYLSKCVESLTESVFRKLLLLRYVFLNLPCSYILLNRQEQHRATYFKSLFWQFCDTKLYQESIFAERKSLSVLINSDRCHDVTH